jgi:hypothetical protein
MKKYKKYHIIRLELVNRTLYYYKNGFAMDATLHSKFYILNFTFYILHFTFYILHFFCRTGCAVASLPVRPGHFPFRTTVIYMFGVERETAGRGISLYAQAASLVFVQHRGILPLLDPGPGLGLAASLPFVQPQLLCSCLELVCLFGERNCRKGSAGSLTALVRSRPVHVATSFL